MDADDWGEHAVVGACPVAIGVFGVVEHVVPADGAIPQELAHGFPAVEVVCGLQDCDVGDQVVGDELIVDACVVVLAQVGDRVDLDAGELCTEGLRDEVEESGGVAAHVQGYPPAFVRGRAVQGLELFVFADRRLAGGRGGGRVRGHGLKTGRGVPSAAARRSVLLLRSRCRTERFGCGSNLGSRLGDRLMVGE